MAPDSVSTAMTFILPSQESCPLHSMSVLVACLGLFELISHVTEQRTQEIGVRKMLDATSAGIVELLSRELTWTVLRAILIAWPGGLVAWWPGG